MSLYSKTKVRVEETLRAMASSSFTVTALRQATVYGLSPRMRFDVFVNRMTLHAFREKRIRVHGGGTQWRPLVHVRDVAGAFMLAAHAAPDRVNAQVLNGDVVRGGVDFPYTRLLSVIQASPLRNPALPFAPRSGVDLTTPFTGILASPSVECIVPSASVEPILSPAADQHIPSATSTNQVVTT